MSQGVGTKDGEPSLAQNQADVGVEEDVQVLPRRVLAQAPEIG
jgi:hypothetical protein